MLKLLGWVIGIIFLIGLLVIFVSSALSSDRTDAAAQRHFGSDTELHAEAMLLPDSGDAAGSIHRRGRA